MSETTVLRPFRPKPAHGPACLVVIYGESLGRVVSFEQSALVVGRSDECDVMLAQSDVSRRHCRLRVDADAAFVQDLGSTNGTFVNDVALAKAEDRRLESGDRLRVGGVILKYLEGSDLESLYHEEIHRTIIVDGLTGLYNRRYLCEWLEREVARSRRHRRPLSVVLLDIDHFKAVNDEHGHLAGDVVLREIAALIQRQTRREACAARYGGEEFAVLMPETDLEGAKHFAERLRGSIEIADFEIDGRTIHVTVSIGVAQMSLATPDVESLLRAADGQLYAAKRAGRNGVCG